jgi:hypothetical protein
MHADVYGQAVHAERTVVIDEAAIERARDLHMLRLANDGVPYRLIARYFFTSPAMVCRRLKRMPKHVRSHYENHPLVGMGRAHREA